jgi:hypothetical protein
VACLGFIFCVHARAKPSYGNPQFHYVSSKRHAYYNICRHSLDVLVDEVKLTKVVTDEYIWNIERVIAD